MKDYQYQSLFLNSWDKENHQVKKFLEVYLTMGYIVNAMIKYRYRKKVQLFQKIFFKVSMYRTLQLIRKWINKSLISP